MEKANKSLLEDIVDKAKKKQFYTEEELMDIYMQIAQGMEYLVKDC